MIGLAVGWAGALVLSDLMRALLYGVGPHDPITFAGVSAALFVTILAAR